MKKFIAIFMLFAGFVFADPPEIKTMDYVKSTATDLKVYQNNVKTYRWTIQNNGLAVNGTGYTQFMYWAKSSKATAVVTAQCAWVTQTNCTFDATFTPSQLNTNGSFIYGVGIISNGISVVRQGLFQINPDPYAVGVGSITFSTYIDWNFVISSNLTNGPYLAGSNVTFRSAGGSRGQFFIDGFGVEGTVLTNGASFSAGTVTGNSDTFSINFDSGLIAKKIIPNSGPPLYLTVLDWDNFSLYRVAKYQSGFVSEEKMNWGTTTGILYGTWSIDSDATEGKMPVSYVVATNLIATLSPSGGGTTNLFSGAGTTGLVTSTTSDTNNFLRGDGSWAVVSTVEHDTNALYQLNVHTGAVGTAVHGLGSISTHAVEEFQPTGTYLTAESDPIFKAWTNGSIVVSGAGASANSSGTAIGPGANGLAHGAALGNTANGSSYGAALGEGANGSSSGVAIGVQAGGASSGVSIGEASIGSYYATAVGGESFAVYKGSSFGYQSYGSQTGNVAVGYAARAYNPDADPFVQFFNTTEIGTGTATNNGWFHYRGVALFDSIGNLTSPTGTFTTITGNGANITNIPYGNLTGTPSIPSVAGMITNILVVGSLTTSTNGGTITITDTDSNNYYVAGTKVPSATNADLAAVATAVSSTQSNAFWNASGLTGTISGVSYVTNLASLSTTSLVVNGSSVSNLVQLSATARSNDVTMFLTSSNAIPTNALVLAGLTANGTTSTNIVFNGPEIHGTNWWFTNGENPNITFNSPSNGTIYHTVFSGYNDSGLEVGICNVSTGVNAFAELNLYNSTNHSVGFFFGLNSLNYTNSGLVGLTNDAYSYNSAGGSLYLGASSTAQRVGIFVGNTSPSLAGKSQLIVSNTSITATSIVVQGSVTASASFSGPGGSITNLQGGNIAGGTVAIARLPASVLTNVIAGVNMTVSGQGTATAVVNCVSGTIITNNAASIATTGAGFTGNGSGLTNVWQTAAPLLNVYLSTNAVLAAGAFTILPAQNVIEDVQGGYNTNTYIYTIPSTYTGKYMCYGEARFATASSNNCSVFLYEITQANVTNVIGSGTMNAQGVNNSASTFSKIITYTGGVYKLYMTVIPANVSNTVVGQTFGGANAMPSMFNVEYKRSL